MAIAAILLIVVTTIAEIALISFSTIVATVAIVDRNDRSHRRDRNGHVKNSLKIESFNRALLWQYRTQESNRTTKEVQGKKHEPLTIVPAAEPSSKYMSTLIR